MQYIQLFKSPDENDAGNDDGSIFDSFTYFSDFVDYDDDASYSSAEDDGLYYYSQSWSEDSFCADVFDNISYYFGTPSDNDTSNSSSSSEPTSYYQSSVSFTGGFHKDTVEGHGTWTAGTAAGSISSQSDYNEVDDLSHNNGVAPGAKISIFDAAYAASDLYPEFAGNGLWDAAMGTGAKIHSNSWGGATFCEQTGVEYLYDTFMHEVKTSLDRDSNTRARNNSVHSICSFYRRTNVDTAHDGV